MSGSKHTRQPEITVDEGALLDEVTPKIKSSSHSIRATMQPSCSSTRSPRLLPPIAVDADNARSGRHSPVPFKSPKRSDNKLWSRYHSGCVPKDIRGSDWSHVERKSPIHGIYKKQTNASGNTPAPIKAYGESDIINALDNNFDILELYVLEKVPYDVIRHWFEIKRRKRYNLLESLHSKPNELSIVWELARCISSAISVDAFRIYKFLEESSDTVQYFLVNNENPSKYITKHLTEADAEQIVLMLQVARGGGATRRYNRLIEPDFPDTPRELFKAFRMDNMKEVNFLMYQPILSKSGRTVYVIEFWRINEEFSEIDEQISSSFQVWGNVALHYCNLYLDMNRERNMTNFLLDVVKAIFEEMISLDQLIKRILEFAQRLVNADRASLFLVDYRSFELVSTVFDLKFESGHDGDMEKKEIRMPINRGIAGHVAMSGETMNIPDAYSDFRFNRAVDEVTGYKTISILCMPIKVQGKVIGVVQMVNKRNEITFDHDDEVAFEIFATFFGLALHHARLYDKIMRKEQKYRVALEVLSYHNTCRENEVEAVTADSIQLDVDLNDYYLDPYQLNEFTKCKMVIVMFSDLFDISKFDIMTVVRFVLTVKKNYRTVPYHNFDHGWSVAHSMYVILKNDIEERFDYKMRLALFVAGLCHDLDHRGYTNKYMSETASPLAAMYTTSTLEHHHFNITVTILQQDGHNIFAHMSGEEYKEILGLIKLCILATDLAAFFPNLAKMKELHAEQTTFNWDVRCHRELAMTILMTSADLSASSKPWKIQIKTVKVIFEEFYDQGDKERAAGKEPISMMDRNKPEEQPASQVGFLTQICLPCYEMLRKIIPNTRPMYDMVVNNLRGWRERAALSAVKEEDKVICGNILDSDDEDNGTVNTSK